MAITFASDCRHTSRPKQEPCICSQMCEAWVRMYNDGEDNAEIRRELAKAANPGCFLCSGTGVETVEDSDAPELYLSSDTAGRLLAILGLPAESDGLPVAEARRALMRGRSRGDLSAHVREPEIVFGKPCVNEEGVVELRPLRSLDAGLGEEGLRERVERFASFVMTASERGATRIWWG